MSCNKFNVTKWLTDLATLHIDDHFNIHWVIDGKIFMFSSRKMQFLSNFNAM